MEIPSIEQFNSNSVLPFSLDYSGDKDKKNIPSIEEDSSLSKKATLPTKPSFDKFQPQTDWNLNSQIGSIQDFYQSKFGTNLPVQLGQKAIHNKWNFDHRNSADVDLNPNSDEGKQLISYLKENDIPYLAFTHAINGVATGPHIHIGFASHKTNQKYAIGTTLSEDNIPSIEDESTPAIDDNSLNQDPKQQQTSSAQIPSIVDFGLSGTEIPVIDVGPFKPSLTIEERIAQGAANVGLDKQTPRITVENPSNLVGSPIITTMNSYHKPTINEATDAWLSSIGKSGPIYAEMNKEYRDYTGTNLVRFDLSGGGRMVVPLKSNQYKIQGQLTQDSLDVLNAYISARNSGGPKDAAEAAFLKGQENDRKMQAVLAEIKQNNAPETVGDQLLKAHPYLARLAAGAFPIATGLVEGVKGLLYIEKNAPDLSTSFSTTINGVPIYLGQVGTKETSRDILSGLASAIGKDAQLVHNLRTLPEALYKLERYGGDSQEYDDLMERDKAVQANLNKNQGSIYQPKDIIGKSVAGATSGLVDLPKYALAGQFGGAYALPILSYIEEIHRGNREATMAALPMAIMGGAGHGLNEFLGAGTRFNFNTFDEDGNPVNKTVELGQGLGNRAPFTLRDIRDYALKDKWSNKFGYPVNVSIESAPVTIKHLTSLERQLLLKGSNALFMSGTQLGTQVASQNSTWNPQTKRWEYSPINVDPNSLASSFVVGLTFPVGKNRIGDYSKPNIIENPPVDSPSSINIVPQLEQPRVNIPLASPTTFGKLPIIESDTRNVGNTYLNSYESPTNKYKETTTPIEPNLEKGFQARNTATTLHLDLDTAALNLLDLKRALADKTFVKQGAPMLDNTTRMLAIQRAISTLEKSIPEQTRKFFEDHEQEIRAAIRTNFEAQQSKADFLKLAGEKSSIAQEQNPSNIKPNENAPSIGENLVDRLRSSLNIFNKNPTDETASAILGETGSQNVGIRQATYLKAVDRTLRTKSKDGIEYRRSGFTLDDMKESGKAIADLTTIAAFHLEDFYHRRIEPSLSEFANRMRLTLGDLVKNFSDKDFQTIFSKGQDFLNANIADPFFSRMKQDAVEKLPNKFTAQQAQNILEAHVNEFGWTAGLEDFLKENDGKKISKQQLLDVINKGQVRVEASVAEEFHPKLENRINELDQRVPNDGGFGDLSEAEIAEYKSLKEELYRIPVPKYSLKAYSGEKLELPGAENSKEVKLISSISVEPKQATTTFEEYLKRVNVDKEQLQFLEVEPAAKQAYENFISQKNQEYLNEAKQAENKYQAPHWDEPNVVAHYRSNDRTTTDNIPIYFSEEFQSDWNHDIREYGLKATEKDKTRLLELKQKTGGYNWNALSETEKKEFADIEKRIIGAVEPNPFMEHSWKELVLKRFLRDAVVTKDENGNYKYEGIGWTTARQQQERYGKVLEGKDFKWTKNSDGTYTFRLRTPNVTPDQMGGNDYEGFISPHELSNISLERFAELTTKEAAQEVRDQETKDKYVLTNVPDRPYNERVFYKGPLEHDIYLDFNDFNAKTFASEEEAKNEAARMKELRKVDLFPVENKNLSGQFSLKEVVELRGGNSYRIFEKDADPKEDDPVRLENRANKFENKEEAIAYMKENGLSLDKYKVTIPYADYDVAFVNMAKKIGKRFGANYSEKNIETDYDKYSPVKQRLLVPLTRDGELAGYVWQSGNERDLSRIFDTREEAIRNLPEEVKGQKYFYVDESYKPIDEINPKKQEKIHFLEITPTMRASLEREGLPLYGLGSSEPLKSNEFGVRNRVIEIDPFNKAREDLVNSILNSSNKEVINEDGHAFNSGLPPSAFLDLVKLSYSDVKDFADFSRKVIKRFGEGIRDFIEGLWYSTKGLAQDFKSKLDVDIDNFSSSMKEIAENAAWKIRQAHEDQRGVLFLNKNKSKELEEYFSDDSKHQGPLWTDGRAYMRMIALAQLSTKFSEAVYEPMRLVQRVMASYESNIVQQLKSARKVLKNYQNAVDAIYDGNEQKRTWTVPELTAKGLSQDEIGAYLNIRKAMNNVLNLRMNTRLYSIDKKATTLNDKLLTLTPNSPEWTDIANQLIDLGQLKQKTIDHFQNLKDTGYISLQRRGNVAAFIEDPNFPVGDSRRKIYNQFQVSELPLIPKFAGPLRDQQIAIRYKEVNAWINKQKAALGIPPGVKAGEIYDLKNLGDIAFREKLTPSQFEDLVDRSGAKQDDPEIEKVRAEVYSRYPSMTYQLEREFIRGYDRTSENVIKSIAHQADLYGASFYSSVGGEQALEGLEKSGLQHSDPNLYKIAMSYIKDETAPSQLGLAGKLFAKGRKFTYFYQLAFDINQLYLNAVAQPITQTYGYFSRVEVNGQRLSGLEPETYFKRAGELTAQTLKAQQDIGKDITQNLIKYVSKVISGKAAPEFAALVEKLTAEHVLSPEFQKSFLEYETANSVTKGIGRKTIGHWASTFMRGGEKVTRVHAAAEAFLIGTEKFNLSGNELESFMVRAVDATQSNPTRGENPYYVRQFGEGGKLIYQFMAFNHMWWENLALGTILDKTGTLGQKAKFATRELYPLILMGGLTGLPLSGFAHFLTTILTGDDPKKKFNRMLGKDSWLENFALYGFSGNQSLSQKLTPSAPVLDNADESLTGNKTLQEYVPAVMTIEQIVKGLGNVVGGIIDKDSRKALYGVEQGSPRAARGVIRAIDYGYSGVKNAKGETTIPRSKLSPVELVAQGLNISPNEVTNYYNKRRTEELVKKSRDYKVLRKVQRTGRQLY